MYVTSRAWWLTVLIIYRVIFIRYEIAPYITSRAWWLTILFIYHVLHVFNSDVSSYFVLRSTLYFVLGGSPCCPSITCCTWFLRTHHYILCLVARRALRPSRDMYAE